MLAMQQFEALVACHRGFYTKFWVKNRSKSLLNQIVIDINWCHKNSKFQESLVGSAGHVVCLTDFFEGK